MKQIKLFIIVLLVGFFLFFIFKSFESMTTTSLHDFDEADRAESARNMKQYGIYWSTFNGSPFSQTDRIPVVAEYPEYLKIHYHLERPPLVFWFMAATSSIISHEELGYRLPSFIFGILLLIFWIHVTKKLLPNFTIEAFCIGFVSLITSYDWWLNSQNALLDTALSLFLFVAVCGLIFFSIYKTRKWLVVSGISLGLAVLSKGQPAFIYIFPVLYLFFTKKISIKDIFIITLSCIGVISVWYIPASIFFGHNVLFNNFVINFVKSRSTEVAPEQQAPLFWYARWWWDMLRPGWSVFITLVLYDFIKRNVTREKVILLSYFAGSFILYSFSINKVWWYVLPLIPVMALYIYMSSKEYVKNTGNSSSLYLIVIVTSLPFLLYSSNTFVLLYGFSMAVLSLLILLRKITFHKRIELVLLILAVFTPLFFFAMRFPSIKPTYPEVKEVGRYYASLEGEKCLFIQDIPYESILFYSKAQEVNYLGKRVYDKSCDLYLVTLKENKVEGYISIFEKGKLKLMKEINSP